MGKFTVESIVSGNYSGRVFETEAEAEVFLLHERNQTFAELIKTFLDDAHTEFWDEVCKIKGLDDQARVQIIDLFKEKVDKYADKLWEEIYEGLDVMDRSDEKDESDELG